MRGSHTQRNAAASICKFEQSKLSCPSGLQSPGLSASSLEAAQCMNNAVLSLKESPKLPGFFLCVASDSFTISNVGCWQQPLCMSRTAEVCYVDGSWSPLRPGKRLSCSDKRQASRSSFTCGALHPNHMLPFSNLTVSLKTLYMIFSTSTASDGVAKPW